MLAARRFALVGLAVALACDRQDHPPPNEPSAAELVEPTEPPAGQHESEPTPAPVAPQPPSGDRYASRFEFSGSFFVHTEWRIDDAISGTVVFRLHDDGQLSACVGARETDVSSRRDQHGQSDHRESQHTWINGLAGSWTPHDSGLQLRFERIADSHCEVPPDGTPLREPLVLDCTRLAADAQLPGPALRCEVPEHDYLAKLAVFGDPLRAWRLYGERPKPEQPKLWLLLGADPGFEVTIVDDDGRRYETPRINVTQVADPVPTCFGAQCTN